MKTKETSGHQLYTNQDKDAPDSIKDSNGDIALSLCKICGKGEAELLEKCISNESFDKADPIRDCNYNYTIKPNQKEFKEFNAQLFRNYINKFSRDDKFNALIVLLSEMNLSDETKGDVLTMVSLDKY